MNATQALLESVWRKPAHYAGFSPDGDYLLASQHRDSDTLTRSNWISLCDDFSAEPYDSPVGFDDNGTSFDDRPPVYTWRASHCLVGWVEYLMVRIDAPAEVVLRAAEALARLDDYPVYDESHWSELEEEEAQENWKNLDLRGRAEILHYRDGSRVTYNGLAISLFAIRHDYPPSDDNGYIAEQLRND